LRRILVAEDDILLATIHEITLSEAGFDVLVCRDGEQALEAMDAFDPDLLITDFSMPRRAPAQGRRARRRPPRKADLPGPPAGRGAGPGSALRRRLPGGLRPLPIRPPPTLSGFREA
jgi:CheY-like chemotaxis protein